MLDIAGKPQIPAKQELGVATVDRHVPVDIWMASVLLSIVGIASVAMFLAGRGQAQLASRREAESAALTTELAGKPYAETLARVHQITEGLRILRTAQARGTISADVLREFQSLTSPGVSLTSLSIDERGLLRVSGDATTYQDVANFLATLRQSQRVLSVELLASSLSETQTGSFVQFAAAVTLTSQTSSPQRGQ